jgi:hypothetical protein
VVLLTPLFFGAAHLHHLRERVVHEGVPLGSALAMVGGLGPGRPCWQAAALPGSPWPAPLASPSWPAAARPLAAAKMEPGGFG